MDASSTVDRTTIDRASFEDLLDRAARGEFPGGRPVDCDDLEPPLDETIRERIAAVVDVAEASGHREVLVIAGDRPLVVDVAERTVDAELAGSESPDELRPIDAAVRLSVAPDASTASPTELPSGIVPAAIAHAIRSGGEVAAPLHRNPSQEATDHAA